MNKKIFLIFPLVIVIFLTGCQNNISVCEQGSISFRDRSEEFSEDIIVSPNSQSIVIKKKTIYFDQVISGQLCNNSLEGTVYIGCDIEVYKWSEAPNFLNDCNFQVKPGTVIYVASHNNRPFYKGCDSCHSTTNKEKE